MSDGCIMFWDGKKMSILGFDASLRSSGYCYRGEGDQVMAGTIQPKKIRGMDRLDFIQGTFNELIYYKELVVYEDYSMGSKVGRVFSIGELGGVLKLSCYREKVPVLMVPPSSLKMFITGKGMADKETIRACIQEQHLLDFEQDDEADAFVLMLMGEYYLENRRLRGTSHRVRAIKGCSILK